MAGPTGNRMDNSFAILITFDLDPDVGLWEKSVKPFGVSAGGPIDTTTGRNITLRTAIGKKLKGLTQMSGTVAYDETQLSEIIYMIGKNQLIQLTFPTGTPITFWGVLDSFEPNEFSNVNEDQPTAAFTIFPTNQSNAGVEIYPNVGTTGTTATGTTITADLITP